ncbi:peptidylprolyl isomerase [Parasphingorhabdus sp.]|uniref:peptidylprolyl isomerase n=1 Tax=Parasphingorhabdus sp. TaxID=2709688 RepID=UPI0032EE9E38
MKTLLSTSVGDIELELNTELAPATCAHFLAHIDKGLYDGSYVYRAMRREHWQPGRQFELIQGGLALDLSKALPGPDAEGAPILHKSGTISLATGPDGKMSSEFFICLRDCPDLDKPQQLNEDLQMPHSPFGAVVSGMDVVAQLNSSPTSATAPHPILEGQILEPPIVIRSIVRL